MKNNGNKRDRDSNKLNNVSFKRARSKWNHLLLQAAL